MRLLDTSTTRLQPPVVTTPRYAILSHTWGDNETTYSDLVSRSMMPVTPTGERDDVGSEEESYSDDSSRYRMRDKPLDRRQGIMNISAPFAKQVLRLITNSDMYHPTDVQDDRRYKPVEVLPMTNGPRSPIVVPTRDHAASRRVPISSTPGKVHRPSAIRTGPPQTILYQGKIENACSLSLSNGYRHLWVDTCCIDKTNSTELSEAINSMFRWYTEADICYAYLADVPDDDDISHRHSEFRRSRWFTRGWTLQELIAPKEVHFYSQNWKLLGSKSDLKDLVAEITRIPADVLLGGEDGLRARSVAEILSWASRRQTTLKEDMAYSLLGLFDLNMPLLYGEGTNAFLRLQEELLGRYDDESIFAWEAPPSDALVKPFCGLLSPSITYFQASHRFSRPRIRTRLSVHSPVALTNRGISLTLPTLVSSMSDRQFVALLDCSVNGKLDGELQPGIKIRRLTGNQFARVDIHHIDNIHSGNLSPFTPDGPSLEYENMIFPASPQVPLPITGFALRPTFEGSYKLGIFTNRRTQQIKILDSWPPQIGPSHGLSPAVFDFSAMLPGSAQSSVQRPVRGTVDTHSATTLPIGAAILTVVDLVPDPLDPRKADIQIVFGLKSSDGNSPGFLESLTPWCYVTGKDKATAEEVMRDKTLLHEKPTRFTHPNPDGLDIWTQVFEEQYPGRVLYEISFKSNHEVEQEARWKVHV